MPLLSGLSNGCLLFNYLFAFIFKRRIQEYSSYKTPTSIKVECNRSIRMLQTDLSGTTGEEVGISRTQEIGFHFNDPDHRQQSDRPIKSSLLPVYIGNCQKACARLPR